MSQGRALATTAAELLAWLAVAAVQTGLTGRLGTHAFAGPDTTEGVWVVEHVADSLLTDPGRVFEGNTFFPEHDAVLFADPLLGPAVLAAPLRRLTANPVLLYNVTVLLVLALASLGFSRLGAWLAGGRAAGLLAGLYVPYAPPQLFHLVQLNLLTLAGVPVFLFCLLRLLERPGPWPAMGAALGFAFQAGTSGYHALSCAGLALLLAAAHPRLATRPRVLAWSLAATVLAGALLWPYLGRFDALREGAGLTRGPAIAARYSLEPRDLVGSASDLWRGVLPRHGEPVFPGLTLTGLAALGAWRGPRRHRRWLLLVAAAFLLLSFGPVLQHARAPILTLPTAWLYERPPFDAVRHPTTFTTTLHVALGLLASLGWASIRWPRPAAAAGVALLLVFAENRRRPPGRVERPPLPEVHRWLMAQPPGAVLELPFDDPDDHRYWAILHGRATVSGAGAFEPVAYGALLRLIKRDWTVRRDDDLEATRAVRLLLRDFPVRYVVLHAGGPGWLARNLERTPRRFRSLHRTVAGEAVYRLERGGRGRRLERGLRDDQAGEAVSLVVRGRAGATARASWNGRHLLSAPLDGTCQELVLRPPARSVARGLNVVVLEAEEEIELASLRGGGEPPEDGSGAGCARY